MTEQIEGILGPQEIGVMMAILLFSFVTTQVFTYFRRYPKDPKVFKVLVGVVWSLLFAFTIMNTFSLYRRTITDYGQLSDLEEYPEGTCGTFALSGLVGSIVQLFFIYRLYKLSGRIALGIVFSMLALLRFASIFSISVTTCLEPESVLKYLERWKWLVILALSLSALIDLLVAGLLSYCLWCRREEAFKHTKRVVDKIIVWTIQTGALTSISSISTLLLYVFIRNFAWMAAYLVISGLFANFFLAALNGRNDLREDMQQGPTLFSIEMGAAA